MKNLCIKNLSASINDKPILNDFNLQINEGEIHVIMGPNGTGKSTLSKVIMGDSRYKVNEGSIIYNDIDITNIDTCERANLGIFLSMQMPLEIEGVTNADLLRTSVHYKEKTNFKLFNFIKDLNEHCEELDMNKDMIHRGINCGFSGGERKKNEILQMYMLKPSFIILDEIDSGLDVDSLKIVSQNILKYYHQYKPSILIITHYQRLLDYIKPDYIHIMNNGSIKRSGGFELVQEIEKDGFKETKKDTISSTCIIKEKINNE